MGWSPIFDIKDIVIGRLSKCKNYLCDRRFCPFRQPTAGAGSIDRFGRLPRRGLGRGAASRQVGAGRDTGSERRSKTVSGDRGVKMAKYLDLLTRERYHNADKGRGRRDGQARLHGHGVAVFSGGGDPESPKPLHGGGGLPIVARSLDAERHEFVKIGSKMTARRRGDFTRQPGQPGRLGPTAPA